MTRILIAFILLGLASHARAAVYKIDPDHSTVMFRIRHLAGHVTGQFTRFQGEFTYEKGEPKVWKASATIDAASVDTHVAARDKDLRSDSFFDVEEHPAITFVSTKVKTVKGGHAKLLGKLTIRGTTKNVALDLTMEGTAKGPDGKERADFTATTRLNRKDYGLTWSPPAETGGILVGDDVDITLDVEGIRR